MRVRRQRQGVFAWPFGQAGMVVTVDGLMSLDELTEIVLEAAPSSEPNGS